METKEKQSECMFKRCIKDSLIAGYTRGICFFANLEELTKEIGVQHVDSALSEAPICYRHNPAENEGRCCVYYRFLEELYL